MGRSSSGVGDATRNRFPSGATAYSNLDQVRWLDKGDVMGQRRFIHNLFGIAA
jgi:hypothetical protein